MNVNATFFIQIANFYLFYWLLRLFLFKPAVSIITNENNALTMLIDNNDQYKKSIAIKHNDRQKAWIEYQEYFKAHQPHCVPADSTKELELIVADDVMSSEISDYDITFLAKTVSQRCGEKIKHVH
jgi:hypothetical protein